MWIALALLLLVAGSLARGLPLVPRRLMRAMAGYYVVSYVGRGVYLVVVNPRQSYGTLIGDQRLLRPDYLGGLEAIAPEAAIGLAVLFGAYYATSRALARWGDNNQDSQAGWSPALTAALGIGWTIRLYLVATQAVHQTGLLARIAVLPTAAVGLLIVGTDWRSHNSTKLIVAAASLGEVFWAVESSSKGPALALALFFYLDPKRRRVTWQAVMIMAAGVAVAFAVIQPAKVSLQAADYAGNRNLFLAAEVVARFDLLHAVTDADTFGPGSYMHVSEFVDRASSAWIPETVTDSTKVPSGVLWGFRMSGSGFGTAEAEGPTGEGYAIAGYAGIVIWNAGVGMAAAFVGFLLSRRRYFALCLLATAVMADNALFERGLLGLDESIATGVQLTLLALLPYAVIRLARPPVVSSRIASPAGFRGIRQGAGGPNQQPRLRDSRRA